MDFPEPDDHQANFENDAWEAFTSLGRGYAASPIPDFTPPTVDFRPPNNKLAAFPLDEIVIERLINKRLIREESNSYELTERGWHLYNQLSHFDNDEGQRRFVEVIR
jgi:hypothetical protein